MLANDRPRGNGHKLEHRKFQLNLRKHFFPVRVPEQWHRLPREGGCGVSFPGDIQTHLDMFLCPLF